MTITLEAIKAEQTKIAEMILRFEQQSIATTEIHFPEALIELNPREEYAGMIIGKVGELSYHLVLMPGQITGVTWEDAKKWATDQGGELPNRREQSLLFANLKDQFDKEWYWSGEPHAEAGYAWYQSFTSGSQGYGHTYGKLRARAVRRLVIQ